MCVGFSIFDSVSFLLKLYIFVQKAAWIVRYYHVTYEFQSESTHYSLPECQGTPCTKQAPYLKFN